MSEHRDHILHGIRDTIIQVRSGQLDEWLKLQNAATTTDKKAASDEYANRRGAHAEITSSTSLSLLRHVMETWQTDTSDKKWLQTSRHQMADEFRIFFKLYEIALAQRSATKQAARPSRQRRAPSQDTATHNKAALG
jgi:hypothetical protein